MKIKLINIERVVGSISDAGKEQAIEIMEERFKNQIFEELEGKEREKTPEELQMIELANKTTDEIRKKYGLDNFDIPPANIHIIKKDEWPREGLDGVYDPISRAVALKEQPSKIGFMEKTLHEMIHFKSYNALQVTREKNPKLAWYRMGLFVETRDGEKIYLKNLNEAVTEELGKKFAPKMFENPLFAQELEQTKETISKHPTAIGKSGKPLFDKDTIYAEVVGKQGNRIEIKTEKFTFPEEREILNVLIDKLFERNQESFRNREEIFELFAKGMMTGNILPLGRLINKTFGQKTFKKIGELDQDIKAQKEFINSL